MSEPNADLSVSVSLCDQLITDKVTWPLNLFEEFAHSVILLVIEDFGIGLDCVYLKIIHRTSGIWYS